MTETTTPITEPVVPVETPAPAAPASTPVTPAPAQVTPPPASPAPVEQTAPETPKAPVEETVAAVGLDYSKLAGEYHQTGDLSAETRADLEKRGIPKELVDGYLANQKAADQLVRQGFVNRLGGEDKFAAIYEWARDTSNFSEADRNAFNSIMETAQPDAIGLALDGLRAKYEASMGTEPTLLGGDAPSAPVDRFESPAQVTAAMRDPRYRKDSAYRDAVTAKLARSAGVFD